MTWCGLSQHLCFPLLCFPYFFISFPPHMLTMYIKTVLKCYLSLMSCLLPRVTASFEGLKNLVSLYSRLISDYAPHSPSHILLWPHWIMPSSTNEPCSFLIQGLHTWVWGAFPITPKWSPQTLHLFSVSAYFHLRIYSELLLFVAPLLCARPME